METKPTAAADWPWPDELDAMIAAASSMCKARAISFAATATAACYSIPAMPEPCRKHLPWNGWDPCRHIRSKMSAPRLYTCLPWSLSTYQRDSSTIRETHHEERCRAD